MRIDSIDLEFQGTPNVIAAFLVHGPEGPVLIETGPGSTLPRLLAGLERHGLQPGDIADVLLTHIHLDHAGAAGWWAGQGARIWVHPNGARHLIDPTKLIKSATRIYGERMEPLWGEILPAPTDRVISVNDGAKISAGGLTFDVVETPGHARHHHVFVLDDVAFAGDAAGIMLPGNRWIDLPAPPPEFDLEQWKRTLQRLRGFDLRTLYRTHFGPGDDVEDELQRFEELLEHGAETVREMLAEGLDRASMVARFTARMRARAAATGTDPQDTLAYELANPREMSIDGIARYWRKRDQG